MCIRDRSVAAAHDVVGAELAQHLLFVLRMRDGDRVVPGSLRELHAEVAETADADDGDAVAGLGLRDSEAAPHREAGAEDRRGLLVAHRVGNEHGRIGARRHELGVASLRLNSGADAVLAELLRAAQTPLAAAA